MNEDVRGFNSSRRGRRILLWGIIVVALGVVLGLLIWRPVVRAVTPDVRAELEAYLAQGGALSDRNGVLLRLFPDSRGDARLMTPIASCSALLLDALLIAEDRNFFRHPGIDFGAILRAAWQNIRGQRIVSGASTITQQVIRIMRPRPRTLGVKVSEMLLACKLEMQLDKRGILEAYLNLAPMFGNVRGAPLAAAVLFDKHPSLLTPAEAATLAALPKSPHRYNPTRVTGRRLLERRRNLILAGLATHGRLEPHRRDAARKQALPQRRLRLPFRAPHFVEWWVQTEGVPRGLVRTSIDVTQQDLLVSTLIAHRSRLQRSGAWQAAGMVVHTPTMEIRAMAGSFAYGSVAGGFNNGCLAPRSGGSILKPFLTALALENGYHAASVISDTKRTFRTPSGDYLPYNASRAAYGPVTLRIALGNSLNISAVRLLNEIGIAPFFTFLTDLGILAPKPGAERHFGLGLAIGNPEVRMTDLVAAYGTFAHRGHRVELRRRPEGGPARRGLPLMSPATAFIVLDILADPAARLLTFGNPRFFRGNGPMAIKTGTSTNYRDNWLIAVHPEYLIAFWSGNFDNRETYGLSGAVGLGPVLFDLRRSLLGNDQGSWFSPPNTVQQAPVCGISGFVPTPFCPVTGREWFARGHEPDATCPFHLTPGGHHELAPEYAHWLAERRQTIRTDPYRLGGGLDPLLTQPAATRAPGDQNVVGGTPHEPGTDHPEENVLAVTASGPLRISLAPGHRQEDRAGWGRITIVSPHAGDHYIMIPGQENTARLRAVPEAPLPEIIWLIDGREFTRTPPPYETYWPLQPGAHTITALTPGEEAAQISIFVE
jgi:penicillin-binding protein 1C